MICSMAAKHVYRDRVVCIHINYANRDTADTEESFVRWWCSKIGIKLFTRRIGEIHRPLCMKYELRDTYESYTRNVRYACYKAAWKHLNQQGKPRVILGHNKDDCFENILTNIKSRSKYENLGGMTAVGEQDNIIFLRPLLDVSKSEIINAARQSKIPYLYDSTPVWSQRGKIRDTVVPVLTHWDPSVIPSFFALSAHLTELSHIVEDYTISLCQTADNSSECVKFSWHVLPRQACVWRKILSRAGFPQPSGKSLENLLGRIALAWRSHERRIVELSKAVRVTITKTCDTYLVKIVQA